MPAIEEMLVTEWMGEHWERGLQPPGAPVAGPSVKLVDYSSSVESFVHGLLYRYSLHDSADITQAIENADPLAVYQLVHGVIENRPSKEHLSRAFHQAPYVFDIVTDIGAYRDLHRHRRSIQTRQEFTNKLGYVIPKAAVAAGIDRLMSVSIELAFAVYDVLQPHPSAQYILPFATLCRSMHRMDFEQLSYVIPLRSGVKGHDSYRWVAHEMWQALHRKDPFLAAHVKVTHPDVQDLLTR
jgi:thymidylate synthase ThyX